MCELERRALDAGEVAIDPSIGKSPLYKGGRRGRSSELGRRTSEQSGAGAGAGDSALARWVGVGVRREVAEGLGQSLGGIPRPGGAGPVPATPSRSSGKEGVFPRVISHSVSPGL